MGLIALFCFILFILSTHLFVMVLIKKHYDEYKAGDIIYIIEFETYDRIKHIEDGVIYTMSGRIYTFHDYLKNKFN